MCVIPVCSLTLNTLSATDLASRIGSRPRVRVNLFDLRAFRRLSPLLLRRSQFRHGSWPWLPKVRRSFHEIFLTFWHSRALAVNISLRPLDCSRSGFVKSLVSLQFKGSTRYLRLWGIVALSVGCGTLVVVIIIAILILAMVD
jgi:hypothetical protein